jgi:hypothetical protein
MNTISSRSLARRSILAAATLMAGSAALLTAACSNGQAATGSGSPASPTSTPTAPSSAAPAISTPAAVPSSAGAVAADGCPVSADTLLTALKRSSIKVRVPASLIDIVCYQNYANAWTPLEEFSRAGIVFRYDVGTGTWSALNIGSGGYCEGYVPREIAAHLGAGCG